MPDSHREDSNTPDFRGFQQHRILQLSPRTSRFLCGSKGCGHLLPFPPRRPDPSFKATIVRCRPLEVANREGDFPVRVAGFRFTPPQSARLRKIDQNLAMEPCTNKTAGFLLNGGAGAIESSESRMSCENHYGRIQANLNNMRSDMHLPPLSGALDPLGITSRKIARFHFRMAAGDVLYTIVVNTGLALGRSRIKVQLVRVSQRFQYKSWRSYSFSYAPSRSVPVLSSRRQHVRRV